MSPNKFSEFIKRGPLSQLPKRSRKSESAFESLPMWPSFKAVLDGGLGEGEAVDFRIPDEIAKEHDVSHRRTGSRFLKKYVSSLGLKYTVTSFRGEGCNHFRVHNPVLVVSRRKQS